MENSIYESVQGDGVMSKNREQDRESREDQAAAGQDAAVASEEAVRSNEKQKGAGSGADGKSLQKRIAGLEKELETLRQQRDAWEEKARNADKELKYQQADLENFKRRQQERLARQVDDARLDILRGLVDLDDNVRLATRTVEQADNLEGCKEGIEMLSRKFSSFLEAHGIHHIECRGAAFDPDMHEAVMMVESGDHHGQIVQDVIQEGYSFNDRVLRMAKVTVAQGSGSAPAAEAQETQEVTE